MASVFDPKQLTRTERQKISKRARRNVRSEVTLIFTAGFALMLVVLFWFGDLTFLPLAKIFGIGPSVTWIGLAALISFAFGLAHSWIASRGVAIAQAQQFELHRFDGANQRAETEEKIRTMNYSGKL
ncbi:MAG: hypothetical protein ACU0A6_01960 [Shimia sp.]|jgi:hypothetical protein|uniref:hypothetical protein n=1 Tax=Shimia sp. TaxID=1954381 RepID=UPI004059968E